MNTYQYRKQHNLCVACGKVPPRPGKTKCLDCSVAQAIYHRDRYYAGRDRKDRRGKRPVFLFTVYDEEGPLFSGTSREIVKKLGGNSAKLNHYVAKGMMYGGYHVERERIKD